MTTMDWNRDKGKWIKVCTYCKRSYEVDGDNWSEALENMQANFRLHSYHERASRKSCPADNLIYRCRTCEADTTNNRISNGLDRLEMLSAQGNKCLICAVDISFSGGKSGSAKVDHNKTTGKIRGILCNTCNTAIGHFEGNIDWLGKAIKYLKAEHENN